MDGGGGEGDLVVVGDVDEIVSTMSVGGGVQLIARGRKSGSNGEEDGEEKGLSVTLWLIGKVKARGVGDMMDSDGVGETSVVTSSDRKSRVRCAGMIEDNRDGMRRMSKLSVRKAGNNGRGGERGE
jgi:hypothetical protein